MKWQMKTDTGHGISQATSGGRKQKVGEDARLKILLRMCMRAGKIKNIFLQLQMPPNSNVKMTPIWPWTRRARNQISLTCSVGRSRPSNRLSVRRAVRLLFILATWNSRSISSAGLLYKSKKQRNQTVLEHTLFYWRGLSLNNNRVGDDP